MTSTSARTGATLAVLCALTLQSTATAAAPQVSNPGINPQPRRGLAAVWAAGVSLSGGAVDPIRLKAPGPAPAPLPPWYPNALSPTPDYSITQLAPGHPFASATTPVEYDAISTGRSRIFRHDGSGWPSIVPETQSWLAVTVSVSNASQGVAGGHIARVASGTQSPGAEFVSHYMDPNQVLPRGFAGQTLLETTRTDLGYSADPSADPDGLDYALGVATFNQQVQNPVVFVNSPSSFYFSVTEDWADDNVGPFCRVDGGPMIHPAHPGDVYRMTFDPSQGGWSVPERYVHWEDLITGPVLPTSWIDVDGLDVDPHLGTMVYSATLGSNVASQLMIHQKQGASGQPHQPAQDPVPLVDSSGERIVRKLDISDNEDEIDAVCTFDPERGEFSEVVAVGTPPPPAAANQPAWTTGEQAGLSIQRFYLERPASTPADGYVFQVTGWGDIKPSDRFDSVVELWYEHGGAIVRAAPPAVRLSTEELTTVVIEDRPAGFPTIGQVNFFAVIWPFGTTSMPPGYPEVTHFSTVAP